MNEIITQVLEMLQARINEREVSVRFEPAETPAPAHCDRDQLVQVLLNVLTNALAIVAESGQVRITTRVVGERVELRVEDDGPGIPPERRDAVFEPFVSFRSGGIGLGLPIVREIVELHDGTITIEEATLGGACFVIRLPTREQSPATPAAPGPLNGT